MMANVDPEPKEQAPPFGAEVIVGDRFLQDQELLHFGVLGFILGMGSVSILVLIWSILVAYKSRLVLILIGFMEGWFLWLFVCQTRKMAGKYNDFGWGAQAEEWLEEALRRFLDQRWTIFRNIRLSLEDGDIDMILVGPGGVYAVEVKRPRTHQVRLATIQRHRTTAKRQKKALEAFLSQQGITCSVIAAVALKTDLDPADIPDSRVPLWLPLTLHQHLAILRSQYVLPETDGAAIQELLKGVAESNRASTQGEMDLQTRFLRRLLLPEDRRSS